MYREFNLNKYSVVNALIYDLYTTSVAALSVLI